MAGGEEAVDVQAGGVKMPSTENWRCWPGRMGSSTTRVPGVLTEASLPEAVIDTPLKPQPSGSTTAVPGRSGFVASRSPIRNVVSVQDSP